MKLLTERVGNVVVCRPDATSLTADNASDLKKEFLRLFVEESPKVVLDLSGVTHVDSTGLGAILFGMRNAKNYGGKIKICNPQERVQKLIDIAQLGRMWSIHSSVEEAIEDFKKEEQA